QDVAVFASTWLPLVGVAYQVLLPRKLARHEAPLQTRGKAGTTSPPQARLFHGGNHLVLRQGLCTLTLLLAEHFAQGLVTTARLVVAQPPVGAIQSSVNLGFNVPTVKTCLPSGGHELRKNVGVGSHAAP